MLEGELGDFTLPDVLRLFALTGKTGRLVLRRGEALGRIDVADGAVTDASADARRLPLARRLLGSGRVEMAAIRRAVGDRPVLPTDRELAAALVQAKALTAADAESVLREQTVDAAFDLLRWHDGGFRFDGDAGGVPGVLTFAIPVEDLLEEAELAAAAWPEVAARTGADDDVVAITRPAAGEVAAVPADGWSLLALVDGRRTVGELTSLCGRGALATRRTLATLVDAGVVTIGGTDASPMERLLHDHASLASLEVSLGAEASPSPAAGEPAPTVDAPATAAASEPPRAAPEPPRAAPKTPADEPEPLRTAPARAASEPVAVPADAPVTPLRSRIKTDRLRTDPSIDADTVRRLIDGVESL